MTAKRSGPAGAYLQAQVVEDELQWAQRHLPLGQAQTGLGGGAVIEPFASAGAGEDVPPPLEAQPAPSATDRMAGRILFMALPSFEV